jgi:hypothetical protein
MIQAKLFKAENIVFYTSHYGLNERLVEAMGIEPMSAHTPITSTTCLVSDITFIRSHRQRPV